MFYFRLNQVTVVDNHDGGGLFHKDGKPTIQFLSFITSEKILGENDIKNYNAENDPAKKKEILRGMINNVTASFVFTPIRQVRDGDVLTFGEGLNLYEESKIPKDFSWRFIAIKLKDKNRQLGEELGEIAKDADFDKFANSFPAVIGMAATPASTAGIVIGKFLFGVIGKHLKNTKDEIMASLETSFIEKLHYPKGIKEGKNISDSNSTHPTFALDYLIINVSENADAVGGSN